MSNVTRAERAERAVIAYDPSSNGSADELISDLLADLMHLVDNLDLEEIEGRDFAALLASAEINYLAEIEEEKGK